MGMKVLFSFAMLAVLSLYGCSDDEDPIDEPTEFTVRNGLGGSCVLSSHDDFVASHDPNLLTNCDFRGNYYSGVGFTARLENGFWIVESAGDCSGNKCAFSPNGGNSTFVEKIWTFCYEKPKFTC